MQINTADTVQVSVVYVNKVIQNYQTNYTLCNMIDG